MCNKLYLLYFMCVPFQEITIELLRDAMRQHKDCPGFLIDGFPREIQQGLQFEQEVCIHLHCTYSTSFAAVN